MKITVNYELSTKGQNAALIAGLGAAKRQRIVIDDAGNSVVTLLENNRTLDKIFEIDGSGIASLDLFALEYIVDGGIIQGVRTRIYVYNQYDAPITSVENILDAIEVLKNMHNKMVVSMPNAQSEMDVKESQRRAADLQRRIDLAESQLRYSSPITNYESFPPELSAKIDAHNKAHQMRAEAVNNTKLKIENERLAWINNHGSKRLRKTVEAGYNAQRLYVLERAAIEFPKSVVDFDSNADWKPRSLPSENALERSLAINDAHPDDDDRIVSSVVWLTIDETGQKLDSYDQYEAIAITGYLGQYTLLETV